MTNDMYKQIELVLYAYACDTLTSKQVRKTLGYWGYEADLVSNPNSNRIAVTDRRDESIHYVEV